MEPGPSSAGLMRPDAVARPTRLRKGIKFRPIPGLPRRVELRHGVRQRRWEVSLKDFTTDGPSA
ncbi:hypothetical protein GCM10009733_005840 [Nonomuraea maheshkhaliensis]|uniref:Transposase n=1 Tax=Nonomuraea maheshkhaliensis TaxID=419590 RepID=A0ABP4QNU0_9ACTN